MPQRSAPGSSAEVVYEPKFEAGLVDLLVGPPQTVRYAIPSSWRRRHRKHQLARR